MSHAIMAPIKHRKGKKKGSTQLGPMPPTYKDKIDGRKIDQKIEKKLLARNDNFKEISITGDDAEKFFSKMLNEEIPSDGTRSDYIRVVTDILKEESNYNTSMEINILKKDTNWTTSVLKKIQEAIIQKEAK